MLVGGRPGYRLLRWLSAAGAEVPPGGAAYVQRSKLEALFGPAVWAAVNGSLVIDFGCGTGTEAIEMARRGAAHVTGVDIRAGVLEDATRAAASAGVSDHCSFTTRADRKANLIISLDAFEHFADPAAVLDQMAGLLLPGGSVWISFGPTWLHPYGGHLFSVFPWAHLVFTEGALIRWRSDFKSDGARRFGEVEGGLNQITLARFERLVRASRLRFETFDAVPIRRLRLLHNRLTRELLTSVVRCRLVMRG